MRYGIVNDAMLAMWGRDMREIDRLRALATAEADYEAYRLWKQYDEMRALNEAIVRQQLAVPHGATPGHRTGAGG